MITSQSFNFITFTMYFCEILDWAPIFSLKWSILRLLVKIKSIPDWHLFISQMETKWTKWYAMTSHVIAYRSLELLFGTHTFHFNCKYAAYLGCCNRYRYFIETSYICKAHSDDVPCSRTITLACLFFKLFPM